MQQSQSTAPSFGDVQASQQSARTYQKIMTTRPLLQKVIDQLAATIANTLAEVFIQETQSSRLADIARLQALAEGPRGRRAVKGC